MQFFNFFFDPGTIDLEIYRSSTKSKLLPAVVPGQSVKTIKQATGMPKKKFTKVKQIKISFRE